MITAGEYDPHIHFKEPWQNEGVIEDYKEVLEYFHGELRDIIEEFGRDIVLS